MYKKPVIFVVIPLLIIAFIYGSYNTFSAFAVPWDPNWGETGDCKKLEQNVRCSDIVECR